MEKNAPKFNLNKKLLLGAGAVLVLAIVLALLLWPSNILGELTVEAGRESISANDFRKEDKGVDAQRFGDRSLHRAVGGHRLAPRLRRLQCFDEQAPADQMVTQVGRGEPALLPAPGGDRSEPYAAVPDEDRLDPMLA